MSSTSFVEAKMHYFCEGGCGGHASGPATCHATDCPKIGEPFTECDCGDVMNHAKGNGAQAD